MLYISGVDPSQAQWDQILDLVLRKKHFPFFDMAYQVTLIINLLFFETNIARASPPVISPVMPTLFVNSPRRLQSSCLNPTPRTSVFTVKESVASVLSPLTPMKPIDSTPSWSGWPEPFGLTLHSKVPESLIRSWITQNSRSSGSQYTTHFALCNLAIQFEIRKSNSWPTESNRWERLWFLTWKTSAASTTGSISLIKSECSHSL